MTYYGQTQTSFLKKNASYYINRAIVVLSEDSVPEIICDEYVLTMSPDKCLIINKSKKVLAVLSGLSTHSVMHIKNLKSEAERRFKSGSLSQISI